MGILRISIAIILALFFIQTHAGSDPVTWSISPTTGFRTVSTGESTSVLYTLTASPKLPGAVVIQTSFTKTGGAFTTIDHCNNRALNPGSSCAVTITYTPNGTSAASIQMSYQYNRNVIKLPLLPASGTGLTSDVVGTISNLPTQFTLNNPEQQPIFKVTYTNKGSSTIIGYAGDANGSNILSVNPAGVASVAVMPGTNLCGTVGSPVTLKPGEKCTISGKLTPQAVGQIAVSGIFTYTNGTKITHSHKTSTVVNGSGSCQLTGEASLPFQNPTYQYADNVIQFTFTNHCTASTLTLGNVSYTASGSSATPTITPSTGSSSTQYDTCSGATITPGNACTVLVSIIPQAAGSLTLTASVTAGGLTANAQTSTTVQVPGYTHKVTFVNQCPFPVWYGVSQPPGSSDPTPNPSQSAYLLPSQVEGAAPSTKSITIPGTYGGQFFPRTGCTVQGTNFVCATGDCGSGINGQCPANSGNVFEPYTRIEETFTATTQGGYDLSLINGTSIPAELKGLGPQSSQFASPASPFVCTGTGAPIQAPYAQFNPSYPSPPPPLPPLPAPVTPLGSCPWTYTAPSASPLYNFVTNATTVTDCNSCTSPNVCGLAFQTTPSAGNVVLACGKLIGYWSINQLCSGNVTYVGTNPSFNPTTVFNCNSPITNFSNQAYPVGTTVYDLYACVPRGSSLGSCYNSDTGISTCCGAKDWNASAPYLTWQDQQAFTTNADWVNGSTGGNPPLSPTPLESIEWLKNACPTAYSYPFDDHSSTFNCNTSDATQQNPVAMDFQIVFCPGGIIGALSQNP